MTLNVAAIATLKARLVVARDEEARAILAEAVERTPKETGALAASGRVVSEGETAYITALWRHIGPCAAFDDVSNRAFCNSE